MNATTNKSYNGYTVGFCCSCSGTGRFERQYGTGSAASGACFRCSGTGYVSEQDAKRNWIHDTGSTFTAGAATGTIQEPSKYTTVVFMGVRMQAQVRPFGLTLRGKSGDIHAFADGTVEFSDGIPAARREELTAATIEATREVLWRMF